MEVENTEQEILNEYYKELQQEPQDEYVEANGESDMQQDKENQRVSIIFFNYSCQT